MLRLEPYTSPIKYGYALDPIDWGWGLPKSVLQTADDLLKQSDVFPHDGAVLTEFLKDWRAAKTLATRLGWMGDFRERPSVFWVPIDGPSLACGFLIKQDHSGSTYVMSPIALPWLEASAYSSIPGR